MTADEKRDLIRFITDRLMGWYVNDLGDYYDLQKKIATGYSIRPMKDRTVFDPIDDANCRDLVVGKMAKLGFWSKQYFLIDRENQELEYAAKFISVKDEAAGGYGSTISLGIAVCIAAQRAILRQKELANESEPRYWLDEIKHMVSKDQEYHGN